MSAIGRFVGLVVAGTLATTLAACSSGASSSGGGTESLNVWLYQKPIGLFSPLAPASGPDGQVMSMIYQSLLTPDPEQNLVPELAESEPKISADAKVFTFKIRADAAWSDGAPLTSKDLLFTYTMAADPDSGSAVSSILSGLTFSAPDDSTFVITSETASVGLLAQIGMIYVMPEHALGDEPVKNFATNAWFNAPELASGPYEFVENKVDQYVKVTANPEYHKTPEITDIYLKPVTPDVALAQLGTGEMDVASISPTDIESVESLDGMSVSTAATGGFVRGSWNLEEARFKDPRVRQAFLYGLDRKAIVDSALAGEGVVRNSAFDPGVSGEEIEAYDYDPEKAKQLLEEAGWDSSEPVEVAWIANTNPDRDAAATAIESQLNEIGISVKLRQVQAEFFPTAYENQDFDMTLYGGGSYAFDSWNVQPIVSCDTWIPAGANIGHYCNEELDALMKRANATKDPAGRSELYKQAAAIENEDPSMMWLYSPNAVWAAPSDLQNFEPLDPSGFGFYKPEDWSIG